MTKEEFETIIKPIMLLNGKESQFIRTALLGNFQKWNEQKQLTIPRVVNCVYVVTERDNYGEQLFKGVFANREKAVEYLAEDGLKESNIDEINEIELD